MNIKVKIHYMPWEVDYALLQFIQLKILHLMIFIMTILEITLMFA